MARTLIAGVAVNVILSVALAKTVGLWGVALATLITDLAVLLFVVPALVAPAAAISTATFARAALRPVVPAAVAAVLVLVLVARAFEPNTLLELFPLGVAWIVVCGFAIVRFGLDGEERTVLRRTLRGGSRFVAAEPV